MALISLKCTYCGGELQADNTWGSVVCPYCRTTFAVMPDINNYNTTNNINANVVNIYITAPTNPNINPDFIIDGNILKSHIGSTSEVVQCAII